MDMRFGTWIEMELEQNGGGTDRIHLAQEEEQYNALVNTAMNLRAPYNIWKFFSS
jgi:hypothetical protein